MDTNKILFNAQYYGQFNLFTSKDAKVTQPNTAGFWGMCYDSSYLLLRTVDQLTNEELIQVAEIMHLHGVVIENKSHKKMIDDAIWFLSKKDKNYSLSAICLIEVTGYLKAIGILLPFTYLNQSNKPVTLSTDEILQLGWAQIEK